jgi:hypothetical protein
MREIYKYFLVALVSLGGVFFLSISLLNALFLDFLVGWIRETHYPGYTISCDTLKGGLLEGFYLGGFKVASDSSSREVFEIGNLYIRVDLSDLLQRKLTIKQARLGHVRARIRNLDEFFKNLGVLFTQAESTTPSLAYFKSMELSEVYFFDLRFLETLDLFFSKQWQWITEEEFSINRDISFYGDLKMLGSQIHVSARALGERVGSVREELPITLEMILDSSNLEGQIAFQGRGLSMRKLFGMRELHSKGAVTVETRLLFSKDKIRAGGHASSVRVPGGLNLFYTLQGEGRAFFQRVRYRGLEFKDLYLRSSWSNQDFRIEHFQTNFLGSVFEGLYEYTPALPHKYSLESSGIDIAKMIGELGVDPSSLGLKGNFSIQLNGDSREIRFSPLVVEGFEIKGSPVFLQDINLESIPLQKLGPDMKVRFLSNGGSYRGGYVDKVQGEVGFSGATVKVQCNGVPINEVYLLHQRAKKIPLKGRLNLEADAILSFDGSRPQVVSKGRFYELELGEFPLESFNFETRSIGLHTTLEGVLTLPLGEGEILVSGDLDPEKGDLNLEGKGFEFGYFRHGISTFPVSGRMDGNLKLGLYPEFEASVEGTIAHLDAFGIPFSQTTLKGSLDRKSYEASLLKEGSEVKIKGEWELKDPFLSSVQTLSELVQKRGNSHLYWKEENISLYRPIFPNWARKLEGGSFEFEGLHESNEWNLKFTKLSLLGSKGSKLHFKPFELRLEPGDRIFAQTVVELDRFPDPRIRLLEADFSGSSALIKWTQQTLELFKEFLHLPLPIPIQARIAGELELSSIFTKPRAALGVEITDLSVDVEGEGAYLDGISAKIITDSEGTTIENVILRKDGGSFRIEGFLPYALQDPWTFTPLEGKEMDLEINLPRTPISVLREFFPQMVQSAAGSFEVNARLSGFFPIPKFEGKTALDIENMKILVGGKEVTISKIVARALLKGDEIFFEKFNGSYENIDFFLTGQLFPKDQFRFLLKGEVSAHEFSNSYLKIKKPRMKNTYLTGALGRISGFGTLGIDEGMVLYEPLMEMIKAPSRKKKIPYFETFDFGLKIQPQRDVQFRSDFFLMHTRPDFTLTFKPDHTLIDGHVAIKEGNLRLGRNDFQLDPSSLIRFVPTQQRILLGTHNKDFSMRGNLWDSSEFQFGSLEDKLSLLWNSDQTIHSDVLRMGLAEGSGKKFETYLNLRASAEVSQRNVFLGIHGPMGTMSYSLDSDDETLTRDDLVRLLASRGVSQQTFDRISRSSPDTAGEAAQGQDRDLLSKQLSAQLEDQVLAKPFESLIHGLFQFDEVRLEPGFLSSGKGIRSYRMGTRLSDDLSLSHESEFEGGITRRQTKIRLKLDDDLGLIYQRNYKIDRGFDLENFESERDVQFGFERRFRF